MKWLRIQADLFKNDPYKVALFFFLLFLAPFSYLALRPYIQGDSLLYTSSIEILKTGIPSPGFVPMMISSTYLGLRLVMLFEHFTGDIATAWLLLDTILFVVAGLFFYSLLRRVFDDGRTALIGSILLMTNYAAVDFGMNFLMDMGGWAAYLAAIYFAYRYLEDEGGEKWIYVSAAIIGAGGLYKEYAFVASIVVAGAVMRKHWRKWGMILWKGLVTAALALGPFVILNVYTHYAFDYTYVDWFLHNQGAYDYQNRPVEFLKSFGSIYNFGWFLFLPGLYMLGRRWRDAVRDRNTLFIWLVALSSLMVLLWPVVTRVLFIAMPAAILVSCVFVNGLKRRAAIAAPLLVAYSLASFYMDSYILNAVNIGSLLPFFK